MEIWKEQVKEYAVYCRPDRKDEWINDIDALDRTKFFDLPAAYDDQKDSFTKTAEIMKALDEGKSWVEISPILMEGREFCRYPIGEIAHMMLKYSKHGIEFVEVALGNAIELMPELNKEYNEEVEKQKRKTLG